MKQIILTKHCPCGKTFQIKLDEFSPSEAIEQARDKLNWMTNNHHEVVEVEYQDGQPYKFNGVQLWQYVKTKDTER